MSGGRVRRVAFASVLVVSTVVLVPRGAGAVPASVNVCVGVGREFVLVAGGSPNTSEQWTVRTDPVGHLSLATATSGPFLDEITFTVNYGSNGLGQLRFFGRGETPGLTLMTATGESSGSTSIDVAVDRVDTLTVTDADGVALDSNPGGGDRLVADVDTSSVSIGAPVSDAAALAARTVHVDVTMANSSEGFPVYFGIADIDDPSTDPVLDQNGTAGGDNFGALYRTPQFANTVGTSRVDGSAETDVRLTTQPGDNFRLLATCNPFLFGQVVIDGPDVRYANGSPLTPDDAQVSDAITVWRTLHIEVDTLPAVDGNQILGTIERVSASRNTNTTRIVIGGAADSSDPTPLPFGFNSTKPEEFVGGRLTILGGTAAGSYDVLSSRSGTVVVPGQLPRSAVGSLVRLVDDDNAAGGALDGDEGDAVPTPDTSLLTAGSTSTSDNVLAAAYIIPAYDLGGGATDSFFVNSPPDTTLMYDYDWRAHDNDANFWTAYLLGAYQPTIDEDGDPESEDGTSTRRRVVLGVTDLADTGSTIFAETIRDQADPFQGICYPAGIVAHELAHLFGNTADLEPTLEAGLMAAQCSAGSTTLSGTSLLSIRTALHP